MANAGGAFFDERREWSSRKHEVFEGYVPQFARILGRSRASVYLVDGFAGAGYYGSGEERELGSPILAARIAQQLAEAGRYNLRCINVEPDAATFASLDDNTKPYAPYVDNRRGKFASHIDAILADIGRNPTLFFLDPFGIDGLDWATLGKVARRAVLAKTEFLINFNVRAFDRDAGWIDSFGQKPREAFVQLVNRTVGTDAWQAIYEEELVQSERYRRAAAFYQQRIASNFGLNVASYPVRGMEKGDVKYYLIFGTKHPLGVRIMSSILYGVERRFLEAQAQARARATLQLSLGLFPDPPSIGDLEHLRVEELTAEILDSFEQAGSLTFAAVQDGLMPKWFGRVAERHFRHACRRLVESGYLVGPTRGIVDQTMFRAVSPKQPRLIDRAAGRARSTAG